MMISPEYKILNRALHETSDEYGTSGAMWRDFVRNLSDWGRLTILDYGCGKATLSDALGPAYRVANYDPCIPGMDAAPTPADLVVCGDVMEHVEPEFVDAVLADVRRLTRVRAFFVIAQHEAKKVLADGRNAHLSVHPQSWWADKLKSHGFEIESTSEEDAKAHNCWFICK